MSLVLDREFWEGRLVQACIKVSVESYLLSNCFLFFPKTHKYRFFFVLCGFFVTIKCNIVFKSALFRWHASLYLPELFYTSSLLCCLDEVFKRHSVWPCFLIILNLRLISKKKEDRTGGAFYMPA